MKSFKYTPALTEPDILKKTFTGRIEETKRINEILKNASSGNSLSHVIIIGPKGIGKTHFLQVIYHTIKGSIKINGLNAYKNSFVPLISAEEEYSSSFGKFLLLILEYLAESKNEGIPSIPGNILDPGVWGDREKEIAVSYLRRFKKKSGKIILLMIDNVHEIIENFTQEDQASLRDILMTSNSILLIGSSPGLFDAMGEHNKPFYNFFETIWLNDLSFKDSKKLFKKYAEIDERKQPEENFTRLETKFRVIYAFVGGNPRIILSFYRIVTASPGDSVGNIFLRMLDELVPYFREKMKGISKQQREIIDVMARASELLTPTEIASRSGFPVSIVVTQIKRLEKAGCIVKAKQKRSKRVLYEISDKLLGTWRQLNTAAGKKKIELLVKFYETWYGEEIRSNDLLKQFPETWEMNGREFVSYLLESNYRYERIVTALKYLIGKNRIEALKTILQEIEKTGQTELLEFLAPFLSFINYLDKDKNNEIIERLRRDERALVEEMLGLLPTQGKGKEEKKKGKKRSWEDEKRGS